MITPRDFAFRILRRWTVPHDPPFLPERSDPVWADVPPRQRAFAFDLLTGVLRWRNALDAIIASRLKQPLDSLEISVRAILWLGAYQLIFQEQTEAYAVVDTAVSLARRSSPKAAGLVNAVLRGITRLLPRRGPVDKTLPPLAQLQRRALALDFSTQVFFNTALFPDPAKNLASHLAAVRSHPAPFVDRLRHIHGDALAADLLLRNNQRPLVTLRVDAPAIDVPAAAELMAHATMERFLVAVNGWNDAIEKLVTKGILSPQDPTASQPIRHAAQLASVSIIHAPRKILDLCAGLGTKSLQLARAFPEASISATDIDVNKLKRLAARARQTGQSNIITLTPQAVETGYDMVLVDVPCSNTGVMAKRVQSRWRWPTLDYPALGKLQLSLLQQATVLLSPGGTLIYSTCSIDPAENQDRIKQFLAANPTFKVIAEQFTLPSLDVPAHATHDGGYFAILMC